MSWSLWGEVSGVPKQLGQKRMSMMYFLWVEARRVSPSGDQAMDQIIQSERGWAEKRVRGEAQPSRQRERLPSLSPAAKQVETEPRRSKRVGLKARAAKGQEGPTRTWRWSSSRERRNKAGRMRSSREGTASKEKSGAQLRPLLGLAIWGALLVKFNDLEAQTYHEPLLHRLTRPPLSSPATNFPNGLMRLPLPAQRRHWLSHSHPPLQRQSSPVHQQLRVQRPRHQPLAPRRPFQSHHLKFRIPALLSFGQVVPPQLVEGHLVRLSPMRSLQPAWPGWGRGDLLPRSSAGGGGRGDPRPDRGGRVLGPQRSRLGGGGGPAAARRCLPGQGNTAPSMPFYQRRIGGRLFNSPLQLRPCPLKFSPHQQSSFSRMRRPYFAIWGSVPNRPPSTSRTPVSAFYRTPALRPYPYCIMFDRQTSADRFAITTSSRTIRTRARTAPFYTISRISWPPFLAMLHSAAAALNLSFSSGSLRPLTRAGTAGLRSQQRSALWKAELPTAKKACLRTAGSTSVQQVMTSGINQLFTTPQQYPLFFVRQPTSEHSLARSYGPCPSPARSMLQSTTRSAIAYFTQQSAHFIQAVSTDTPSVNQRPSARSSYLLYKTLRIRCESSAVFESAPESTRSRSWQRLCSRSSGRKGARSRRRGRASCVTRRREGQLSIWPILYIESTICPTSSLEAPGQLLKPRRQAGFANAQTHLTCSSVNLQENCQILDRSWMTSSRQQTARGESSSPQLLSPKKAISPDTSYPLSFSLNLVYPALNIRNKCLWRSSTAGSCSPAHGNPQQEPTALSTYSSCPLSPSLLVHSSVIRPSRFPSRQAEIVPADQPNISARKMFSVAIVWPTLLPFSSLCSRAGTRLRIVLRRRISKGRCWSAMTPMIDPQRTYSRASVFGYIEASSSPTICPMRVQVREALRLTTCSTVLRMDKRVMLQPERKKSRLNPWAETKATMASLAAQADSSCSLIASGLTYSLAQGNP